MPCVLWLCHAELHLQKDFSGFQTSAQPLHPLDSFAFTRKTVSMTVLMCKVQTVC